MKQIRLIFLALILAVMAFSGSLLYGAGELKALKARSLLRIAVSGDVPPFSSLDEKGEPQGFEIHLAKKLAEDLLGSQGKLEFVLVEAETRAEVLDTDKADVVISGFTVTPERAEKVDFAKPYLKAALALVSPSSAAVAKLEDLNGKTLIVTSGTTADFYFSFNHPDITLLKFEHNNDSFQALKDGQGAALAHDYINLLVWAAGNSDFAVSQELPDSRQNIAPAVKKGQTELLNWLNDEIVTLTKAKFFEEAYLATLAPVLGAKADPKNILVDVAE
ncbi:MAG: transporter substrate-binding domain-containing protein [Deltaproteobacteria bacterium]|jgi:polar amino acid transport system substrate-binding protein|nr:transporter substrate-binding domain-containing protein [Deltaproteobacteria bacterium]